MILVHCDRGRFFMHGPFIEKYMADGTCIKKNYVFRKDVHLVYYLFGSTITFLPRVRFDKFLSSVSLDKSPSAKYLSAFRPSPFCPSHNSTFSQFFHYRHLAINWPQQQFESLTKATNGENTKRIFNLMKVK